MGVIMTTYEGQSDIPMVPDHDERTYHEVPDPVGRRAEAVGRSTNAQGDDLGRVQPRHAEPSDGEEGVEYKEEDNPSNLEAGFITGVDSGQDGHRSSLSSGADEHELSAADALHEPDGREGGQEVFGAVERGQETSEEVGHAELDSSR